MNPKFLQVHTLTGYSAVLLNRDDIGRAKRLPFGGHDRIRVSSQCLKRHWRVQNGEWSLTTLGEGQSQRSRRIFSDLIAPRLAARQFSTEQILNVLTPIRSAVLGESLKAREAKLSKKTEEDSVPSLSELHTDQVIVLGKPEIEFLTDLAIQLAHDDPEETKKAVEAYFKNKQQRDNLKALAQGAGIDAALFGRMVTSDLMARCDAAIHVAHAFTVHAEEAEPDYFSALDDLLAAEGELGSGHINTTELTSGLFYAYVVADLGQLTKNLSGDAALASEVLARLVYLIATVSPGAKTRGDRALRLRGIRAGRSGRATAAQPRQRIHGPGTQKVCQGQGRQVADELSGALRRHVRRARRSTACQHDRYGRRAE